MQSLKIKFLAINELNQGINQSNTAYFPWESTGGAGNKSSFTSAKTNLKAMIGHLMP